MVERMMESTYNSVFEIELRILILLEHSKEDFLSSDMIAALDFVVVYGKEFGVSKTNLHGDNRFKFSELPSRREKVLKALKELVKKDMVDIDLSKGFKFQINNKGYQFIEKFEGSYAIEYSEIADAACNKYGDMDEAELYKYIQSKSVILQK